MKITVLGGGHGGYAAAADLSLQGHQVTLWRRNAGALATLQTKPLLTLASSAQEQTVEINLATHDISKALHDAELILVTVPATAHEDLARTIAPHLQEGQIIYLTPGTFGSYLMARRVQEYGCTAHTSFAETGTLPYLARKHGPSRVHLTARATNLPTGVFPALNTKRVLDIIRQAYPCAHPVEDVLSAALMNAGPVIHPLLIVLNAGPLDPSSNFDIHNEGTQPVVRRVAEQLDGERIATRKALGYGPKHYPLRDHYEGRDWMYGPRSRSNLVESGKWREPVDLLTHRYMREDVALGLAFLNSVADWAGIEAPVAGALLVIAGVVCGEDFKNGERTLKSLGLSNHSHEVMNRLLQFGLA